MFHEEEGQLLKWEAGPQHSKSGKNVNQNKQDNYADVQQILPHNTLKIPNSGRNGGDTMTGVTFDDYPFHALSLAKLSKWLSEIINSILGFFLVRKGTIPIERSPPVSEASANFSG
jgi:hypothetical protein